MRVIVCGDRDYPSANRVYQRLRQLPIDTVIVEGGCTGADRWARMFAVDNHDWPLETFPADWARYRKGAGPIRNGQMLAAGADLVIAFHDDLAASKGTWDMVRRAVDAGVPVEVVCTSAPTGALADLNEQKPGAITWNVVPAEPPPDPRMHGFRVNTRRMPRVPQGPGTPTTDRASRGPSRTTMTTTTVDEDRA